MSSPECDRSLRMLNKIQETASAFALKSKANMQSMSSCKKNQRTAKEDEETEEEVDHGTEL